MARRWLAIALIPTLLIAVSACNDGHDAERTVKGLRLTVGVRPNVSPDRVVQFKNDRNTVIALRKWGGPLSVVDPSGRYLVLTWLRAPTTQELHRAREFLNTTGLFACTSSISASHCAALPAS